MVWQCLGISLLWYWVITHDVKCLLLHVIILLFHCWCLFTEFKRSKWDFYVNGMLPLFNNCTTWHDVIYPNTVECDGWKYFHKSIDLNRDPLWSLQTLLNIWQNQVPEKTPSRTTFYWSQKVHGSPVSIPLVEGGVGWRVESQAYPWLRHPLDQSLLPRPSWLVLFGPPFHPILLTGRSDPPSCQCILGYMKSLRTDKPTRPETFVGRKSNMVNHSLTSVGLSTDNNRFVRQN